MKFTLICLGLAVCVALVRGQCYGGDVSRCSQASYCGGSFELGCVSGICTCDHISHMTLSCLTTADCSTNCLYGYSQHCIDGGCHCPNNGFGK